MTTSLKSGGLAGLSNYLLPCLSRFFKKSVNDVIMDNFFSQIVFMFFFSSKFLFKANKNSTRLTTLKSSSDYHVGFPIKGEDEVDGEVDVEFDGEFNGGVDGEVPVPDHTSP